MRKTLINSAFLVVLAVCAGTSVFAQVVTATNGRVTLTPSYGSQCFCPGASVFATSTQIDWLADLDPRAWGPKQAYAVTMQPGNVVVYVVSADNLRGLWIWLPWDAPLNAASITIRKTLFSGGPVVLTEVIPLTISQAAPHLRIDGLYADFRSPVGIAFSGVLTFGTRIGIANVQLYGSDFGTVNPWVLEISDTGGNIIEVPAFAVELGQNTPESLSFLMPRVPPGIYFLQARAQNLPGIVSNIIQLLIN